MTSCHLVQVSVICQGFNSPELPWVELWWDWQQQPSLNCHAAGSDSWLGSPYWLGPAHTCSAHNLLWLALLSWVLMLAGSVQTLFAENRNEWRKPKCPSYVVKMITARCHWFWHRSHLSASYLTQNNMTHLTCQGRNNFENMAIMPRFINFT